MHQASLPTWRSIIAVVFPGTGLFYKTLVLSENHFIPTYEEVPPHALSAFSCAHEALKKAWHAAGVLYFSPALCGESFCPAKQTTHAHVSCAPSHYEVRPRNLYWVTRATVADVFYRRKQNTSPSGVSSTVCYPRLRHRSVVRVQAK